MARLLLRLGVDLQPCSSREEGCEDEPAPRRTRLLGFFVLSLVAGHRLSLSVYPDPRTASRVLIPMAALSLLFTL